MIYSPTAVTQTKADVVFCKLRSFVSSNLLDYLLTAPKPTIALHSKRVYWITIDKKR